MCRVRQRLAPQEFLARNCTGWRVHWLASDRTRLRFQATPYSAKTEGTSFDKVDE